MIGTKIAGWTVQNIIASSGELQRYAVVRDDGRSGTMELAASNSAAAAALVARVQSLPDAHVMDKGIDSFGNPYVVTPAQAIHEQPVAHAPIEAPRIPSARGPSKPVRWPYYLGGGLLLLVVINVAVRAGKSEKVGREGEWPVVSRHTGSWGFECNAPFTIQATTHGQGTLSVLGETAATDITGAGTISIPRERVGTARELTLEVSTKKGEKASVQIPVPPREPWLRDGTIKPGRYSIYSADVEIARGGKTESVSMYGRAEVSEPPEGTVSFAFDACGYAPGTSEQAGATVTVTDKLVRIDVDVRKALYTAPGGKLPENLDFSVTIRAGDVPTTIAIKTRYPSSHHADKPYERWANVATRPIAEAPLPDEVPAPRPIVVLTNDYLDTEHLGTGSVAQAPYVAILDATSVRAGSCGPYGDSFEYKYAKRYRTNVKAKLYEARTGKLVAQTSLSGRSPRCPSVISTYGGDPSSVDGESPDVGAWLARWKK